MIINKYIKKQTTKKKNKKKFLKKNRSNRNFGVSFKKRNFVCEMK